MKNLPELNPPDIMPNGNVGTPTMVFLEYIKSCRLPPKVIKKLGLTFPKTRTNKQYGSVPFNYGGDVVTLSESDTETVDVKTASGHELVAERTICDSKEGTVTSEGESDKSKGSENKKKGKRKSWRDKEARRRMDLNIEEKMIGKEDESEEVSDGNKID